MHRIYHGRQLNYKDIDNSKDKIYCVLEKGTNSCSLVYYIKEKQDKGWALKSIISDNSFDADTIKIDNIIAYQVTEDNKINYIKNNIKIEDEIENVDELFIKTYQDYE